MYIVHLLVHVHVPNLNVVHHYLLQLTIYLIFNLYKPIIYTNIILVTL